MFSEGGKNIDQRLDNLIKLRGSLWPFNIQGTLIVHSFPLGSDPRVSK